MARRSRRLLVPLVAIVVAATAGLTTVLVQGWSPLLGLDLQGGASVVYEATEDVGSEALDDAIEIIRSRVDALGVAEPEIVRQGDAIVVNLPGIDDRERALEVIGRTAELQFRPVLASQPYLDPEVLAVEPGDGEPTEPTEPTEPAEAPATTSTTEGALGFTPGENAGGWAMPRQEPTTEPTEPSQPTETTAPAESTPTTGADAGEGAGQDGEQGDEAAANDPCILLGGTTPPEEAAPDQTVVFAEEPPEGRPRLCYQLGPVPTEGDSQLTGRIVVDPEAVINVGEWGVSLGIRGEDLSLFNQVASDCFFGAERCPSQGGGTGQLAIALDGVVQSALGFQTPTFDSRGLLISGNFTQREARDLALVLRFGALPVQLEPQTVQDVSATLGEDSLRGGLIAGLIGVALVIAYMLVYYRALGLVVVLGSAVWLALNYTVIAWLGETQGLALSLAGVTGVVISVGVTVDAYVVYFERLKEDVRSGRTVRASVDRSFQRAFRTILTANVSSFIGAFFLYVLTVGAVRGFAFFLGLSTVLGVVVAYFFTRPLVALLAESNFFTTNRFFGVGRGLGVARAAATAEAGT